MNAEVFTAADWYKALTLGERSKSLTIAEAPISPEIIASSQRRLERWQNQPQFADEAIFAQRLEQAGVDHDRLERILGEPAEDLQKRFEQHPAWLDKLAVAYSQPALAYADIQPGEEELGFLELIQPLVDQALDKLHGGLADLYEQWPDRPFNPDTIEDLLLMNLPDPLLLRLGRTMVLELNVARLQGLLAGQTPEERFQSFIERLRHLDISTAILAEYPVLARQLVICIDQWVAVCLEFLHRLCARWPTICRRFNGGAPLGELVELVGGAGDTHRGGRSVMVAHFDTGFRLVYKPKSMAVDVHFQELLAWFNERGCDPPLKTLQILDCGDYGWVEFVEYQACRSQSEVVAFYRRLGIYLALLYAINASDFHLENLIAAGEHPLLIDLETLFNPEFERFDDSEAALAAGREMLESVLVAGMLPQRLWSGEDYGGLDISGFGGEEGQMTPDRIPTPAAAGTDEMRYIRERQALAGEANRPRLKDVPVNALDYVPEVIAGFRHMYGLLLAHRSALLANDGPLERFANDETRVLIRPTRTYDQLLFESFHPDALRDALDRDLLLDRLWLAAVERPFMALVIPAEQAEILQGDIPVFTTRPAALDLWSGTGERISGVLVETGLSITRRRLQKLDQADRQRQEWFIRTTLATLAAYDFGIDSPPKAPYRLLETGRAADRQRFLAGARAAADQLARTAIRGDDDVAWIGLEILPGGQWDISPVGMDLYNGIPGIALFLAYAGTLLAEEEYTDLARRAAVVMTRQLELFGEALPGIGAFEGWGGLLYVLTHMAVLWDDPEIRSLMGDVQAAMARFLAEDEIYDLHSGAAGAAACLLAMHRHDPSGPALETARACGDHLLNAAQDTAGGLGWPVADQGPSPLTGFAHGASGIAWSLLKLAQATGDDRFYQAGLQALAYERAQYAPQAQNWPDLRQSERANGQSPRFPVAWCHGAAGIGLARLGALSLAADPRLEAELEIALQTTLRQGFGQSHCLCHGDLGNLDLLLTAGLDLDDPSWRDQAAHMGGMVLDSIEAHGWFCGGPEGVELPGLMLGVAGIGYQLLRLAEPELVPSVLTLAPPAKD